MDRSQLVLSYGATKLFEAVATLVGAGSVQDRLSRAFRNDLVFLDDRNINVFPPDMRERFAGVMRELRSDTASTPIADMSDDAATRIARELAGLLMQLAMLRD